MREKPIYDRVQDASADLGEVLMSVSRAQWLVASAGRNIRLARVKGTTTAISEAEFSARDALQQANTLLARTRIALNGLELPL